MVRSSARSWCSTAAVAALLVLVAACATAVPSGVPHQFGFNGWFDGWAQEVDLLEYSYGDRSPMVARKADAARPSLGYQMNVNGPMPVGDFLYVKWRLKGSGEIHERRVELRPLLPRDMTRHSLTFVIDGPQLYVYLVTPRAKRVDEPPVLRTFQSRFRVAYEIYPSNALPNE